MSTTAKNLVLSSLYLNGLTYHHHDEHGKPIAEFLNVKGAELYVQKGFRLIGSPEDLIQKRGNPFLAKCMDGRTENITEGQEIGGSLPGGGAGALIFLIATLSECFGDQKAALVQEIVYEVLEKFEKRYGVFQIYWHVDTHHTGLAHSEHGVCKCGCGFLAQALFKTPDNTLNSYGLYPWGVDLVTEIICKSKYAGAPEMLPGDHIEKALFVIEDIEDVPLTYTVDKQVEIDGELVQAFVINRRNIKFLLRRMLEKTLKVVMADEKYYRELDYEHNKLKYYRSGKAIDTTNEETLHESMVGCADTIITRTYFDIMERSITQVKNAIARIVPIFRNRLDDNHRPCISSHHIPDMDVLV